MSTMITREPEQPRPEVERIGELVGDQVEHLDGQPGEHGEDEAQRIPITSWHFQAPSCHPTASTTDAMATTTTVGGKPPGDEVDVHGEGGHASVLNVNSAH